jgi:hypothetical protein
MLTILECAYGAGRPVPAVCAATPRELGQVLQTAEMARWEIHPTMASKAPPAYPAAPRQPFTLYAADGRVYASNNIQKLIDLGSLTQEGDSFRYQLDGNQLSADNLPSAEAALRHIADHVRFLYLDGQFTALPDLRGDSAVHLDGAPRIEVMLDELRHDEPIEDARL